MKKVILLFICMIMISSCQQNSTQDNHSNEKAKEIKSFQEKTLNEGEQNMKNIVLVIHDKVFEIELENNETVKAFVEKMPMTLSMNDLNHNEKYCYLDENLPTHEQSVENIQAGDVMLFGNNCLVVFYKSFSTSYQYTRIGKIKDVSELKEKLESEKIEMIFKMKE